MTKKQTAGQRMIASAKEALAFAHAENAHVKQQLQDGIKSGIGIQADKVFDRLETKYSKLMSYSVTGKG
jgi:hypothetical protein